MRVAVVDSGVHATHPHIGRLLAGIAFDDHGREYPDTVDRLGHGTAVMAAIQEKAPDADVMAVKVFDRVLAASGPALAAAIRWAAGRAHVINLSLGTENPAHRETLAAAVADAVREGVVLIAAAPDDEHAWLPGLLPGLVAVELDWDCPRDACRIAVDAAGHLRARASGFPRPIPGVPPARNLKGHSFAVANATGVIAALLGDLREPSLPALVEHCQRQETRVGPPPDVA